MTIYAPKKFFRQPPLNSKIEFLKLRMFELMKILVANIGSTSLKWRLFDFSNNAERLLHKGGFERVTDYPKAIEDCLGKSKRRAHRERKRIRRRRLQDRHRQERHRLRAAR